MKTVPRQIGTWQRMVGSGPESDGPHERHEWFISVLDAPVGLPDIRSHSATGSPAEEGLVFAYHRVRVGAGLKTHLHPSSALRRA